MTTIRIFDSTLRDGSHAVKHQITKEQIKTFAHAANEANIPVVIVGHGNGLGASSLQVGESLVPDEEMLRTARKELTSSKLGVFIIPGFGTISRDLKMALKYADLVCVAAHCTEMDTTARYIEYVKEQGKEVISVLMMTHMVDEEKLLEEAQKVEFYGADGVLLMDSAGKALPSDVKIKVSKLSSNLKIPVGFHAHNNLGMAVANSIVAVESGAKFIDGCILGFGAGAGNAQIEVVVAVLERMGFETNIDLYKILDAVEISQQSLIMNPPIVKPINIVSGLAGVFSGFEKHVLRISKEYDVDPRDVFFELGKRKVVAGQEDLIVEVVDALAKKKC